MNYIIKIGVVSMSEEKCQEEKLNYRWQFKAFLSLNWKHSEGKKKKPLSKGRKPLTDEKIHLHGFLTPGCPE